MVILSASAALQRKWFVTILWSYL